MFNFCSLYSGSSGNSLFVQSKNTNILIDAGESAKKITNALSSINVPIESLDAIVVTHEHIDHIKSIGTISQKYNIPVYATQKTWSAMPLQSSKIDSKFQRTFSPSNKFYIGDLELNPFSIPHDAADPCGFNILNDNTQISVATDLGHITPEIINNLSNSSFILLESNYDPEILRFSKYPYYLKQRISGERGHLSNVEAGKLISKLLNNNKLNSIMLGHLSKENNFPELAYKTIVDEIIDDKHDISNIDISVATRICPSKIIKIS
ncbi:MAG: MBL fold metallo-hydrolase [Clostridia bacterium]|nr:MBL fold metallo-hydrolase [Clostridia bacterium]